MTPIIIPVTVDKLHPVVSSRYLCTVVPAQHMAIASMILLHDSSTGSIIQAFRTAVGRYLCFAAYPDDIREVLVRDGVAAQTT